jgi:ABC-type multidrug transport system fused ATPase/permease subunit
MRLLAPVITFIFFVLFEKSMGREVSASNAFTTLSLISMVNVGTLLRLIPSFKASLACFDRIQSFLESDSRQLLVLPLKCVPDVTNPIPSDNAVQSINNSKNSPVLEMEHFKSTNQSLTATVIDVRNASFGWSCSGAPQINDVSFYVPRGSFIFIIGPVGCGKSTLLKGLMSETPYIEGFVYGNSLESAFADQTPWIQNTTIRQNIVGVSPYNSSWYEEVVKACSLDHDIALLPDLHGNYTSQALYLQY